ncbi:MAG TPA: ribonuclease [Bacteroidales bacterium]|nr:ribonuclease [Bacteroidales bacterium]
MPIMIRFLLLCCLGCFTWLSVDLYAANPNGYYDAINGKKGEALKTTLSNVLLNHTVHDYSSLWTFFKTTDVRNDGSIWDMYSSVVRTSSWGMNREHAFPKSWWGGDVNAAYTDINHLYPSDADANMAKSNYPLGVVGNTTFDNGVSRVGYNTFPGYSTDARVFEPDDAYKGDFARTYFYMVTCYQNLNWRYTYMVEQNSYPTLKPWAVQLLMAWHRQDPVSTKETDRNEAVFKIQNNRNPFIDYPELAEYLWGNQAGQPFALDVASSPVLSTPTNDTELSFAPTIVGNTRQRTLYVKGVSLNAPLSVFIEYAADYTQFATAADVVTAVQGNNGYQLSVSYNPATAGEHTASLLIYDGGIQGSVKVNMSAKAIPVDSLLPPQIMPASNLSSTGFMANWQPFPYAESYRLNVYALNGATLSLVQVLDTLPETEWEVTGLTQGQTYAYTLQSRNDGFLSPPSAEMPVTLLSAVHRPESTAHLSLYTASSTLYFQAPSSGATVAVYTLTGQCVGHYTTTGHLQSVNGLSHGLYVLHCDGVSYKFSIQH